jgi:hypothetical protein
VDECPEWKKNQTVVQYYGSANKGLGFYHINVEPGTYLDTGRALTIMECSQLKKEKWMRKGYLRLSERNVTKNGIGT